MAKECRVAVGFGVVGLMMLGAIYAGSLTVNAPEDAMVYMISPVSCEGGNQYNIMRFDEDGSATEIGPHVEQHKPPPCVSGTLFVDDGQFEISVRRLRSNPPEE